MNIFALVLIAATTFVNPEPSDSLSLQYCYNQISETYPVAKNIELQEKITELNTKIANTGYFPELKMGAKASYQSEVTEFSVPGMSAPPGVSKDQYEASISVVQNIFSGGAVGIRKKLERTQGEQEIHSVKVELHQIRSQIDQVYFGVLLSQQQAKVNALLIENLNEQLQSVRSQVKNGVLLPSQKYILEAELIKARQDSATIQSNIKASYEVLSELIGEKVSPSTRLSLPSVRIDYQSLQPKRAEYDLFDSRRKSIEHQKNLAKTKQLPRISAFGSLGYGRPGYNFMNDDFHEYYMVGIRLQWNLLDLANADREMEALRVKRKQVSQNEKAFSRQLDANLEEIRERMSTINENIDRDKKIIELRDKVVQESESKLTNGAITATEYVTELNQANKAKLSLYINRVQLSEAQVDYATALGVSIEH